jgi:hypothetical protein
MNDAARVARRLWTLFEPVHVPAPTADAART